MSAMRALIYIIFAIGLINPVFGWAEVSKEYYPNGKLKSKEKSSNGNSGITTIKEYYESLKLKAERNYKN